MKKISGIYMIVNKINGKRYVGSAIDLKVRQYTHFWLLQNGKHNYRFQPDWDEKGKENFEFIAIELVEDKNNLIPIEQIWLDYYESYLPENGYNICKIAGSSLGTICSEETKSKISDVRKKQWEDPEMRARWTATKQSKEFRENLSRVLKGRIFSQEHCKNISLGQKGKKLTPEHINKIVAANTGRKCS